MSSTRRTRKASKAVMPLPVASSPALWGRAALHLPALRVPLVLLLLSSAVGVAFWSGLPSVFLAMALGTLLAAIAVLWTSVRTLVDGSTPTPLLDPRPPVIDDDDDEKKRAIAAIHDLADEHSLGKIDDADYTAALSQSREEAKTLMRDLIREAAPYRDAAEALADEHLRKQGFGHFKSNRSARNDPSPAPQGSPSATTPQCGSCAAANDADALFCKRCGTPLNRRP